MLFSKHEVVNCHDDWTSVHFVAFLRKVVEANLQGVMMPPYFLRGGWSSMIVFVEVGNEATH
jgi:hypothetical protein